MKQKTLFVGALVLLFIVFAIATLIQTAVPEGGEARPVTAHPEALVRMHSPTLGRPDAKVTIVEFIDPACGTCAALYPAVKDLLAQHPDQVRLVLRYAPFHPGVDQVIALIEAARRQDRLWPALEALLATQERWTPNHRPNVEQARQVLAGIGLDMTRLAADAADPAIAALIAQEAADIRLLGVEKTPEFFVNGRPLPSFGLQQLATLVGEELARR
ncbi:MAG: thioredoxin domain-containing protein [Pseudomonadota bacterium]|jgi:protein-disulfide isomerase